MDSGDRTLRVDEERRKERMGTFIMAAYTGQIDVVRKYVASGINVDYYEEPNMPAIVAASISRNVEVVKVLLEAGANPNNHTKDRLSALKSAAKNKSEDCVRLLLEHGADPDYENDGEVALTLAVDEATTKDAALVTILMLATNEKYHQKAYNYASNTHIRSIIKDISSVDLKEPDSGFGGPMYKMTQKYECPPTEPLALQLWDALKSAEENCNDPNIAYQMIMTRIAITDHQDDLEYIKALQTEFQDYIN